MTKNVPHFYLHLKPYHDITSLSEALEQISLQMDFSHEDLPLMRLLFQDLDEYRMLRCTSANPILLRKYRKSKTFLSSMYKLYRKSIIL